MMMTYRRLLAAMLLVCSLLGCMVPGAGAEAFRSDYSIENGNFILPEGVQVIGYIPEDLDAQVEGLVYSDAIQSFGEVQTYDTYPSLRTPIEEIVLPKSLLYIGEFTFCTMTADRLRWPEQVTRVMDRALVDSRISEITFHAGVTEYSKYSFCSCYGTERFIVEAGNPAIKTVDGVLFSADGKTLLRYPPKKAGDHYDVPAGVEVIADYAFDGCQNLHSVTLPMGVRHIGWWAFSACVRLESIVIPPTLREIQAYAFSDCVNLHNLRLPQGVQVVCDAETLAEINSWDGYEWKPEVYVFFNTPRLEAYPEWDEIKVMAAQRAAEAQAEGLPEPTEEPPAQNGFVELDAPIPAILNPENARDFIPIYQEPSEKSKVLGRFACGSTVLVAGCQEDWYLVWWRRDCDEGAPDGWVREEDLLLCPGGEPLFEIASIRPVDDKVEYMNNGLCVLPYDQPKIRLPKDAQIGFMRMDGQWVSAVLADEEWGYGYIYFYPSDLLYTRKYTGDNQRFGIVISEDARDRLNLRAKPSKNGEKLGKYFSGTQVEVLEESGDWYRVRVNFQEGWMMKEFIREVPQEPAKE